LVQALARILHAQVFLEACRTATQRILRWVAFGSKRRFVRIRLGMLQLGLPLRIQLFQRRRCLGLHVQERRFMQRLHVIFAVSKLKLITKFVDDETDPSRALIVRHRLLAGALERGFSYGARIILLQRHGLTRRILLVLAAFGSLSLSRSCFPVESLLEDFNEFGQDFLVGVVELLQLFLDLALHIVT